MSLKSIFDLPTSKSQLESANAGFANWQWEPKAPFQSVIDTDDRSRFSDGEIKFRWDMESSRYWMPNKCFLRMRCRISRKSLLAADQTQLKMSDGVAPSMGLMANLFTQMNFQINDQTVSLVNNHIGQIESMYHRLNKSGQWMKDCGADTNMWDGSHTNRVRKISANGVDSSVDSLDIADPYAIPVGNAFDWTTLPNFNVADRLVIGIGGDNAVDQNTFESEAQTGSFTYTNNGGVAVDFTSAGTASVLQDAGIYVGGGLRFSQASIRALDTPLFVCKITSITATVISFQVKSVSITRLLGVGAAAMIAGSHDLRPIKVDDYFGDLNAEYFEICWMPRCLSFLRLPHAIPGGAKFQLNLSVKQNYKRAAIESLSNLIPGTNYDFQVKQLQLYVPTFQGKPYIDKFQFYIDLNEISCQSKPLTAQSETYHCTVKPSTNALAVAIQDTRVDTNTRFSCSKFTSETGYQNKLRRFNVTYDGKTKPLADYITEYDQTSGSRKIQLNDIYIRNMLASGAYFDSSCESQKEWLERGMYIYQLWNKSGDSTSLDVAVLLDFAEEMPGNVNLLLFDFYKKYGLVKIDNGRYQQILINES